MTRYYRRLGLVFFIAWLLTSISIGAQRNLKTRNVVSIVSDGLRWQEVFNGAEADLINKDPGGVTDPELDALRLKIQAPSDRRP